jgi:hypothetical protein
LGMAHRVEPAPQRGGAPRRRAPDNFRKNPNRFPSHGSILRLLLRKEFAVVKAIKRDSTEGEAVIGGRRYQQRSDLPAAQAEPRPEEPREQVGRHVGVSGGAQGRVTYEWMGGFFLLQRVELEQHGQKIRGIEIIGHERPFGAEPGEDVQSHTSVSTTRSRSWVHGVADGLRVAAVTTWSRSSALVVRRRSVAPVEDGHLH